MREVNYSLKSLFTCIESALIISPLNRRANSIANFDLPVAVEPRMQSTGLDIIESSLCDD